MYGGLIHNVRFNRKSKLSTLNQTSNLYIMYVFLQLEKFYGNEEYTQCNNVTDMAKRWPKNNIVHKMKCQRCKIHRKITIRNIALFYYP